MLRWSKALTTVQALPSAQCHLDPSETAQDDALNCSLTPTLLAPTMGTLLLVFFGLADGFFERLFHGFSSYFLDLLFHLIEGGGCIQLQFERYCDVHERGPFL